MIGKSIKIMPLMLLLCSSITFAQEKVEGESLQTLVPISLLDEYRSYENNNPIVLQPSAAIKEENLLLPNKIVIPMNIIIYKADKEFLNTQMNVPNSKYVKLLSTLDVDLNNSEDSSLKNNLDNLLEGKKKNIEETMDLLEVGIIINVEKDKKSLISQVWFEQENGKSLSSASTVKNKGQGISAEINDSPTNRKNMKEVLIKNNWNTKSVASWKDYTILLQPISN
jgi:hypothetical protein